MANCKLGVVLLILIYCLGYLQVKLALDQVRIVKYTQWDSMWEVLSLYITKITTKYGTSQL